MKFDIVLYTQGLQFNGATIERQALGGSETAFIYLARALAKMGHRVRTFCNCPEEGVYDGVEYSHFEKMNEFLLSGECDIFICSRFAGIFNNYINAKLRILWNHDILTSPETIMPVVPSIDYMYCLSDYHKKQYIKVCHDIEPIIKTITNGVDHSIIPKDIIKKHQIMFTSRPERGLLTALTMFERLGDKTLKLIVCNYETFNAPEVREIEKQSIAYINHLVGLGFNIEIGRFTKAELYKHISESKAVLYPSDFPEISCISAMEAQACGTVFLCFNKYALTETVGTKMAENADELFELLKTVLNDEASRQTMERIGFKHAQKFCWSTVASQFIKDALEFFNNRAKDTQGIFSRLIYESDILAAIEYAKKFLPEQVEKTEALIAHIKSEDAYVDFYQREETTEKYDKIPKCERFDWVASVVRELSIKTVIDYGCNAGYAGVTINAVNPECNVVNFDISNESLAFAEDFAKKHVKDMTKFNFVHSKDKIKDFVTVGGNNALLLAEVLEHVVNPHEFIDELESLIPVGSHMILTVPKGAWEWLSRQKRFYKGIVEHVSGFDMHDIEHMFSDKDDLTISCGIVATGMCGEKLGHYLITYKTNGKKTKKLDFSRKFLINRPYQTISACVIAKNAEKDIEHCLDSIKDHVDEIIVLDDQSTDDTFLRASKYTDKVFKAEKTIAEPDFNGFANARNFTLDQASGRWILWIDTDERLICHIPIRQYLDTTLLNAYVIKQHHAQLDNFIEADCPQRLFRKGSGRFVGFIHEQPMREDDINAPITPALIMADAKIAHFGALEEGTRRKKCLDRNLPLLAKDDHENGHRKLTKVLIMRDLLNRIKWSFEHYQSFVNPDSERTMAIIKEYWVTHFKNSDDKIHREEAFKIIQEAMRLTQSGIEIKYGMAVHKHTTEHNQVPGIQVLRVFEEDLDNFFEELRAATSKALTPPDLITV